MRRMALFVWIAWIAAAKAYAQGTVSVDLLDPSETSGTIPANLRIVDVFVDITLPSDLWTASGIRAVTANGATFAYHDGDPNVTGLQPYLFNPGLADKFLTSLSSPRARDRNSRFLNSNAAVAGGYNPPTPLFTTTSEEMNVTCVRGSYPDITWPPHEEGYVARLSVDVSAVPGAPQSNELWGAGPTAPPGATVVLDCSPPPRPASQSPGFAIASLDVPQITGINWQLWFVPEPGTIALFVLGMIFIRNRGKCDETPSSGLCYGCVNHAVGIGVGNGDYDRFVGPI